MTEYDDGPRSLSWPLLHPLVSAITVDDDEGCSPSSFVWPDDPDEKTLVPFYLSLNEYNVLGSTIDVGSDIAFGDDALRVMWLWMRNFRCDVPICDLVDACITGNPATIAAIVAQLVINPTFNTYLGDTITTTSPPAAGNLYPPRPTSAEPEPLCNAATYVVSKIRALFVSIYADLETLTATEVLEALLGVFGWRSGPLYQLIGLLETEDETALLAAFDAAAPDLICQLIEDELDQTAITAWIATTYPPPSVLGDALTVGIESAADDGKYAQWIAVGATMTDADCSSCAPPPEGCYNLATSENGFIPYFNGFVYYAAYSPGNGFEPDFNPGIINIRRADMGGVVTAVRVRFSENVPAGINNTVTVSNFDFSSPTAENDVEVDEVYITGLSLASGLMVDITFDGTLPATFYMVEICVELAP